MHRYLIGLGSNQPHHRHGSPAAVLSAALAELRDLGAVLATSPLLSSPPLGPSRRRYANAAVVLETRLDPAQLLAALKRIEQAFGRRTGGQRWRARVIDLDVVLWSGGAYAAPELTIPHPHFRARTFVLGPARAIAGHWRDPITGLTVHQLHARLTRPRPLPKAPGVVGPVAQ